MKKVFLVFGPPGAGKGTQANLLAAKFNLIHFDTGKHIESLIRDPAKKDDPEMAEHRRLYEAGMLQPPQWVYKMVKEGTQKILNSGYGVVFSGSPRTYEEAFEAEGPNRGFIAFLEEKLGRENIIPILLKVAPETSIKRNSHRLICSICGMPAMYHQHQRPEFCTICGGPFRRRSDDIPETIKVRLGEYEKRTAPILEGLKKNSYNILEVDGEPLPYQVFEAILQKLKL
jgi:adenylate kinase